MTIKVNTKRPEQLHDNEVDFGTAIAETLWKKTGFMQNWIEKAIPVGYLTFFQGGQTLPDGSPIPSPNPDLWVLCDGQQIDDVDSLLHNQFTPDLRKIFLKGGHTSGLVGGQSTINLAHTHGGTLVHESDKHLINGTRGGNYVGGEDHTHNIGSQWSSAEPIIPPFYELQIYLRKK